MREYREKVGHSVKKIEQLVDSLSSYNLQDLHESQVGLNGVLDLLDALALEYPEDRVIAQTMILNCLRRLLQKAPTNEMKTACACFYYYYQSVALNKAEVVYPGDLDALCNSLGLIDFRSIAAAYIGAGREREAFRDLIKKHQSGHAAVQVFRRRIIDRIEVKFIQANEKNAQLYSSRAAHLRMCLSALQPGQPFDMGLEVEVIDVCDVTVGAVVPMLFYRGGLTPVADAGTTVVMDRPPVVGGAGLFQLPGDADVSGFVKMAAQFARAAEIYSKHMESP